MCRRVVIFAPPTRIIANLCVVASATTPRRHEDTKISPIFVSLCRQLRPADTKHFISSCRHVGDFATSTRRHEMAEISHHTYSRPEVSAFKHSNRTFSLNIGISTYVLIKYSKVIYYVFPMCQMFLSVLVSVSIKIGWCTCIKGQKT